MLTVIMLSVVMLCVITQSVAILSGIMICVIVLSVVAPFFTNLTYQINFEKCRMAQVWELADPYQVTITQSRGL